MTHSPQADWRHAGSLEALVAKGRTVVKIDRKQIALFALGEKGAGGVRACNNRCPHEGYPLVQGTLNENAATGRSDQPKACLLTCNWHNWRFDLDAGSSGEGDSLRLYPVDIREGEIYLDVADPPAEALIESALANLVDAMPRHEYDRLGRELCRLMKAGGAFSDAVIRAIHYSHDRFQYGGGHAYAAAPDWIDMAETLADGPEEKLAAYMEILGHMAWDTLRETPYPFSTEELPFDETAFLAAVERQEEDRAAKLLNGALSNGASFDCLIPTFLKAALAHYQGFGHAPIYVYKYSELAERIGKDADAPLLKALLRHLINARREDLVPEFKSYAPALDKWRSGNFGDAPVKNFKEYSQLSVPKTLDAILNSGAHPEELYTALLSAAALQFLQFDTAMDRKIGNSVSDNISWLDFTHAITMANAGRWAAKRDPSLWPPVLLQIGCFLGRNSGYLNKKISPDAWAVSEPEMWLKDVRKSLFDHEFPEYIVSCHYVKLTRAIQEEVASAPKAPYAPLLYAALKRLLATPLKRKHIKRTAAQSLDFIAREG